MGHDIKLLGYGRSFCDCGAGGCLLSQKSLDLAEQCLIGNSHRSLGLDEEGRILGTKESNLVITPFEVCMYKKYDLSFKSTIAIILD